MSLILDAGAFIAYERGSRLVQSFLAAALASEDAVKTSVAIIAQVWRDAARQVLLTKLLRSVEEVQLTSHRARAIGELLRRARTDDLADAALVELAHSGDEILTSDPGDIRRVAAHSGKTLIITPVS